MLKENQIYEKYLDQKSQSRVQDFGFTLRYEICQFIAINIAKRVQNWYLFYLNNLILCFINPMRHAHLPQEKQHHQSQTLSGIPNAYIWWLMCYVWCVMGEWASIKYQVHIVYSKTSTTLSAIKHHSLTSTHTPTQWEFSYSNSNTLILIFISLNCWNRIVLTCELSLETVPKQIFFSFASRSSQIIRQRSESWIEIHFRIEWILCFSICRPSFMAYSNTNIVTKWLPWACQKLSKLLRLLTLWNRLAM